MKTTVLEKPNAYPLSLSEAKTFLRVSHSAEDRLIEGIIETATDLVEQYTKRRLMPQRIMSCIPFNPNHKRKEGLQRVWICSDRYALFLPHGPVNKVLSVERIDEDGALLPMRDTEFHVNMKADPHLLVIERRHGFGVKVVYDVGYEDRVPPALTQAVLNIVGRIYTDRTLSSGGLIQGVEDLLHPYVITTGEL